MSLPRFLIESELPAEEVFRLPLSPAELQHMNVRRIEAGEHVSVLAPTGTAWEVEVVECTDDFATAKRVQELDRQKLPNLTLVQGVSKGDRMTQTIRQTTELGVRRIVPFLSERCIVRIASNDRAKKGERFRSVSLAAVKQCGRDTVPKVDDPCQIKTVNQVLSTLDRVVIAWEDAAASDIVQGLSIGQALEGCDADSNVGLVIGPEGGFSENEIRSMVEACQGRARVVSLGALILRTETAATVATALCMYQLGGLGNEA